MKTYWRLPKGVDELLPPRAWDLELLRRRVLDVFDQWGFDYIEPPLIEYLDALLVGSGEDLDLQTLKVVDQVSGRQLGVRADMTSQAVRVDAHSVVTDGVQRLCYAGPVVFANPVSSQTSRVQFKAGAEIFGAPSIEADAEVVGLMLETLAVADINKPVLLLGHMGIYRRLTAELLAAGDLQPQQQAALFNAVQRKAESDIRELVGVGAVADMMVALPTLMGQPSILDEARKVLAAGPEGVLHELDELARFVDLVSVHDGVEIRIDVAELSGYGYHNGAVFTVYHPEHGKALAQGGRYDGVGEAFGRARSATGFDMNLKQLLASGVGQSDVIFAPWQQHIEQRATLQQAVESLRAQGSRVVMGLSEGETAPQRCERQLSLVDGQWQVVSL
ncbi:MAG: ATP phosphoribosyltransferase regulatory subunit [Pseudomonadales bacterium]